MLFLLVIVVITTTFEPVNTSPSLEQCQSLITASISDEPVCEPLGDCTGLNCFSTALNKTVTFVVQKCKDPVLVNVTVVDQIGTVLLNDIVSGPTVIENDEFNININTFTRNASYLNVQASSMYKSVQYTVIPYTEVPLNASYCMCESLKDIASNIQAPVEIGCITNIQCTGVDCEFILGGTNYFIETEGVPCAHPPGVLFVLRDNNNNILFDSYLDNSFNDTLLGLPLYITVEHMKYSVTISMDLVVGDTTYHLVPESQIILNLADCPPTIYPSSTVSQVAPTATPVVSDETCNALKQIASDASDTLSKCSVPVECDALQCVTLGDYETDFQLLQCNNPPAIHAVIYNSGGNKIFDEVLTETTTVPIEDTGFAIVVKITQAPSAIGLEIDVQTDFGTIPYIQYTEIPLDKCLCPDVTCYTSTAASYTFSSTPITSRSTTSSYTSSSTPITSRSTVTTTSSYTSSSTPITSTSKSTAIVVAVTVPIIIILFLMVVILAIIIGMIFFVKHIKTRRDEESVRFKDMIYIEEDEELHQDKEKT